MTISVGTSNCAAPGQSIEDAIGIGRAQAKTMRLEKPPMALSFVTFLVILALCASAQDWPQWRGPGRDGVLTSSSEPKSWPEKLTMKWQVTAGSGHSSPVVSSRRVYLLTRKGEEEDIPCG